MYQRHTVKTELTPAQQLERELQKPKLTLPSFPDAALRVRKVLEDPNSNLPDVIKVLRLDPAISARVLNLANSAMLGNAGNRPITDLNIAVSRIGANAVRSAAMSLAMQQIYQASAPSAILKQMALIWKKAVRVSAISYVIARKRTKISPDEAMLAGLMHNIGKLYIVNWTEFHPFLLNDQKMLDALMLQFHSRIGRRILESWGFSESLCTVPERYHAITDESDRPADLADIVAIAVHQAQGAEGEPSENQPIPALRRLNLDPETCSEFIQEYTPEIDSLVGALDSK